jgi:sugar phosphate isomerase/epimerase
MTAEKARLRTGISSYAFRYGIGVSGFRPPRPMDAVAFLAEAGRLGLSHAQLCENLGIAACGHAELDRIRGAAADLGLVLEVGMKALTPASLERHIEIVQKLGSSFLRIVLGDGGEVPESAPTPLVERSVAALKAAVPRIRDLGLTIGIENHFDLETERLVEIVDTIGSPEAGLVFDTTNCLGFLRSPMETLRAMGRRVVSVHIKDYVIRKVEAGYLISGEVLGRGLLDVDATVQACAACNPAAPVLLEMTIRRNCSQSPEQAAAWERDAIERSAARLHAAVERAAAPGGAA